MFSRRWFRLLVYFIFLLFISILLEDLIIFDNYVLSVAKHISVMGMYLYLLYIFEKLTGKRD